MSFSLAFLSSVLILSVFYPVNNALSLNYYDERCPNAELLVSNAVKKARQNCPAALARMHFHDCFIRGCDASVLLNSKGSIKAEKDGPPNVSLHAFYIIDNAKKKIEAACPGVVSCADILALAERDAVVQVFQSIISLEIDWGAIKYSRKSSIEELSVPLLHSELSPSLF